MSAVAASDGCNDVRRIALHMAHAGPHYWGSSWEGLTQTRPALLPYAGALRAWVPKSRGPGGSGSPRVGAWIVAFLVVLREMAVSQMKVIVDNRVLVFDCDRALMWW